MHSLENLRSKLSKEMPSRYRPLMVWPAITPISRRESPSKAENWLEGPGLGALNPDKQQLLHGHGHAIMRERVFHLSHGILSRRFVNILPP